MKNETKHAPTPWDRNRKGEIFCDRYTILTVQDPFEFDGPGEIGEQEANAEFIVRAANCHDELVAALERLLQVVPPSAIPFNEADAVHAVLKKAKANQ